MVFIPWFLFNGFYSIIRIKNNVQIYNIQYDSFITRVVYLNIKLFTIILHNFTYNNNK